MSLSEPFIARPMGDRTAETITASGIRIPLFRHGYGESCRTQSRPAQSGWSALNFALRGEGHPSRFPVNDANSTTPLDYFD